MKAFFVFLSIATVASTFAVVRANAAEVNCKDIVQAGDNKNVPCDPAKDASCKVEKKKVETKTDVTS